MVTMRAQAVADPVQRRAVGGVGEAVEHDAAVVAGPVEDVDFQRTQGGAS